MHIFFVKLFVSKDNCVQMKFVKCISFYVKRGTLKLEQRDHYFFYAAVTPDITGKERIIYNCPLFKLVLASSTFLTVNCKHNLLHVTMVDYQKCHGFGCFGCVT